MQTPRNAVVILACLGLTLGACPDDDKRVNPNDKDTSQLDGFDAGPDTAEVLDCAEITVVELESPIDTATTLSGVNGCLDYHVGSNLNVTAPLTLGPGVRIEFAQNVRLIIDTGGSLNAVGTEEAPIELAGENPSAGFWDGVELRTLDPLNELTWVVVSEGGSGGWANLYVDATASVTVTRSRFTNSSAEGMSVEEGGELTAFEANTFDANEGPALVVRPSHLGSLDAASTYAGSNAEDVIQVEGGTVDDDATWPATDAPIHFASNVTIAAAVTIDAGAQMEAAQDIRLIVDTGGSLSAVGTAAAPIRLVGANTSRGFWDGLEIRSTSNANVLDYVTISEGGSGGWANLYVAGSGSVSVSHSTFSNASAEGANFEDGATITAFDSNTFTGNAGPALEVDVQHLGSLDGASQYTGNDDDVIAVRGGAVTSAQAWPATDAPLRIDGNWQIQDDVVIAAGASFVAGSALRIDVNGSGSLNAVGTAGAPITFGGESAAPGFWDGINYETVNTANVLQFVTITDGGSGGWANVYVSSSGSLTMTDCTISNSSTFGLEVESGGQITPATEGELTTQNSFSGNASGDVNLQ